LPGQIHFPDEAETPEGAAALRVDQAAAAPAAVQPFVIHESEIEQTDANIVLEARRSIATAGTFGNGDLLLQNNRSLTLTTRNNASDGAGGINLAGSSDGANLRIQTRGQGSVNIQGSTDGAARADVTLCQIEAANGSISLSTGNGVLRGGNVTISSAGGNINFGAAIGTSGDPLTSLTVNARNISVGNVATMGDLRLTASDRLLVLSGDTGDTTFASANGSVFLNAGGHLENSTRATIVKVGPGQLSISAPNGDFVMGQNEKLVVARGGLSINVNGIATLGDLGAVDAISLTASEVRLLDRQPTEGDSGLDFVAPDISFTDRVGMALTPTFTGTGNKLAVFATRRGDAAVGSAGGLTQLALAPGDARVNSIGEILDFQALLPSPDPVEKGTGNLLLPPPAEAPPVLLEDFVETGGGGTPPGGAEAVKVEDLTELARVEELRDVPVVARPATPDELRGSLRGQGRYEQIAKKESPTGKDLEVVERRLSRAGVLRVLRTNRALFHPNPKEDRREALKQAMDSAYDNYVETTGQRSMTEFREYLNRGKTRGDARAGQLLEDLTRFRTQLDQIGALGLTPAEFNYTRSEILKGIQIENVEMNELQKLVEQTPPSAPEPNPVKAKLISPHDRP
jgi:hypothetical protein